MRRADLYRKKIQKDRSSPFNQKAENKELEDLEVDERKTARSNEAIDWHTTANNLAESIFHIFSWLVIQTLPEINFHQLSGSLWPKKLFLKRSK